MTTADADLACREPSLPGLETVLDPDRLVERLVFWLDLCFQFVVDGVNYADGELALGGICAGVARIAGVRGGI